MKYSVIVEKPGSKIEQFTIVVTPSGRMENTRTTNKQDSESETTDKIGIALESSRHEYEHSFRRAERLDNKAYILLTVCGFLFVPLTASINKTSQVDVFAFCNSSIIFAYDVILILNVIAVLSFLVMLLYPLSGKEYKRYDTTRILENNLLTTVDSKTLCRYTLIKYELAKDYNDILVSEQFKILNYAVWLLIAIVIMLVTLTILGNFLPNKC